MNKLALGFTLALICGNLTASPIAEVEANNTIATAQNVNSALPNAVISATGNDSFDYYSFTVSDTVTPWTFSTLSSVDPELFLYTTGGTLLEADDDAGGSCGSGNVFDSCINAYVFSSTGTFVIGVGYFDSADVGGAIVGNTPDTGTTYQLLITGPAPSTGVPEPGSMLLMGAGLAMRGLKLSA